MQIHTSLDIQVTPNDALTCLAREGGEVLLYVQGEHGGEVSLILSTRHLEALRIGVRMLERQLNAQAISDSLATQVAAKAYRKHVERPVEVHQCAAPERNGRA